MRRDSWGRFGCCSVKTAGIVVAVCETLLCLLAIYGLVYNYHIFDRPYLVWFIVGLISVVVILISIILLLVAIKNNNFYLLLPHLFAQVFLILFCIIVALTVFLLILFHSWNGIRNLLGYGEYKVNNESTEMTGYALIILHLVVGILECLFLYIVVKLYRYLQSYDFLTYQQNWTDNDMYKENWEKSYTAAPNRRGSPAAGDVYPYGPWMLKFLKFWVRILKIFLNLISFSSLTKNYY